MKLVICAPPGAISDATQKLARKLGLPIKTDDSVLSAQVSAFPEKKYISYDDSVTIGHIHAIKAVNEFLIMRGNASMRIKSPENKIVTPVVSERHMAIFHNRFYIPGVHVFDIVLNEKEILFSGEIDVVDG